MMCSAEPCPGARPRPGSDQPSPRTPGGHTWRQQAMPTGMPGTTSARTHTLAQRKASNSWPVGPEPS
eukprot:2886354-Alexandrium_andersonii.AAC.1